MSFRREFIKDISFDLVGLRPQSGPMQVMPPSRASAKRLDDGETDAVPADFQPWASAKNLDPEGLSGNKKLLVAKGIATRSKDATRGSWPYY